MRSLRWSCLVPLALLTGCGGSTGTTGTATTPTSMPDQGTALVVYSRSGGIGGIDEELTIDRSGAATLTSRGTPSGRFQLSPEQLASLRHTLDAAPLDAKPRPAQTGCADCFEYSISYGGKTLEADQVNLPDGMRPALAALDSVITRGTAHR